MTDTIGFGEALKAFRRGVHVYGPDWRGVILCDRMQQMENVREEAARIFEGSSLHVTYHVVSQNFVCDPSGARLGLRLARDSVDTYVLAGNTFTQIIWMHRPRSDVQRYVESMLRSSIVPQEKLRMDYSGL